MREYPAIDSASTVEQLRMRLKEGELEEYGDPFTPEFVYDVIKRLPRFSSMRVSSQYLIWNEPRLTIQSARPPTRCGRIFGIFAGGAA